MEINDSRKLTKSFTSVDLSFSFSRSKRFRRLEKEKTLDFYSIPAALDKRATSFGYGKRSELFVEKCSPPPDTYNPKLSGPGKITISRSGLGERLKLFPKQSPGPGQYTVMYPDSSPKYTIFQKYKEKEKEQSPCAANYNPNFKVTQKNKYSSISFGFGKKFYNKTPSDAPGPGAYSIPSFFPKLTEKPAHSFHKKNKVIGKSVSNKSLIVFSKSDDV